MPDRVISVPQATQIATKIKNKFDNVDGRLLQIAEVDSGGPQTIDIDTSGITRFADSKINSVNTIEDTSNGFSVLWLPITISGFYTVTFSKSSQALVRIYQNVTQKTDIKGSNCVSSFVVGDTSAIRQGQVEAGQSLVCSAWYPDYTVTITCTTDDGEEVLILKQTIGLTEQMETEVEDAVDEKIGELDVKGTALSIIDSRWQTIPGTWEQGYYRSYGTKGADEHRVRLSAPITFARDTYIYADEGFAVYAFKEGGGSIQQECTGLFEGGVSYCIYVRRIVEDTSETADIATFSAKLKMSTPLCDVERFADTFTDLSMFPRIGLVGDSFTGGGGIISGVTSLTWGKNLERQIGSTVDIYARSGQNIVAWNTDTKNGLPALLAGEECGLYWFGHGINGPTGDGLGTIADCEATEKPATFYGQHGYAIEQIRATFPKSLIVIQTIMGTNWWNAQTLYATRNTALREIAEYYSIPLINLADDDFYKSPYYRENMLSNHPTAMMNAGIAHANRRLFAKCVMENPAYFRNYGNKYD